MILFGTFENDNFSNEKYSFKLEFEFNDPWFIEFNNDNLIPEANSCIAGFYHLEIEKDGKMIFETDGHTDGELHPIEILYLIDDNKNWSIKLNEIYGDQNSDLLPIINTTDLVLMDEYNLDNIDVFDEKYHDEFVEYNQSLLNDMCHNSSSFFDSWQELELNFCYGGFDRDDLIIDYANSFVNDVILKNRM